MVMMMMVVVMVMCMVVAVVMVAVLLPRYRRLITGALNKGKGSRAAGGNGR